MQLQDDIIVITAAGAGTWLRERFTPSAWARMFSEELVGDYKEKMIILREMDDKIYEWSQELSGIVKELRKAFKASRLLDVALLIGELNSKLNNIQMAGTKVKEVAESAIKEFESKQSADDIVVSASAWSDFKREWVAKKLENEQRKVRNLAIKTVIDKADQTTRSVQKNVKDLGKARAKGDIGKYISVLKLIANEQKSFVSVFMPVYKKYLNELVEKAVEEGKKEQSTKQEVAPKTEDVVTSPAVLTPPVDLGTLEVPAPSVDMDRPEPVTEDMPIVESVEPSTTIPSTVPMTTPSGPLTIKEPVENVDSRLGLLGPEGEDEEKSPETLPSSTDIRACHKEFMQNLIKLAEQNNPGLLVSAILEYSAAIEDYDLDASLKLLTIAEGILDGPK